MKRLKALPLPEVGRFPKLVDGRIPSLDGLRAIAILLVLKSHLTGGIYNIPGFGAGHLPLRFTLGNLGVRIFFVISGFLISTLLLREIDTKGRISLKQFYVRRALRILPASYVYLLCLVIAVEIGTIAIPKVSFLASFLYFRNYIGGDWYTGHLWSLSVEEQFYLIWPAALALLGRRGALIAACCTLPLADMMRLFRHGEGFETNMDALACGCILASLWGWLGRSEHWQRVLRSAFFWIAPALVLASNKLEFTDGPILAIGTGIVNILIAISIERFVRYYRRGSGSFLNARGAVMIGTLSYSIYLWQEPWLVSMGGNGPLQTFPVNVALASTCAVLSYKFVERPFLALKDRWRTVRA